MNSKLKILDCTLRDGGYYNDWKFSKKLFAKYLTAMEFSGVDIVELGFRFNNKNDRLGEFAYTSEDFLKNISLPKNLDFAVMVNFKDFSKEEKKQSKELEKLFSQKKDSKISIVRIAVSFNDALHAKNIAKILKNLGYEVYLNLMQSNNRTENDFKNTCFEISKWKTIKVLYFADSIGNMSPEDALRTYKIISKYWKGKIGFHSHNNKGFALINSLKLIDKNIDLCDSTMLGMGRGAGNVSTESVLYELNSKSLKKTNFGILQTSLDDFEKLKKTYNWGPNSFYHFAANKNIHPTYVQTMLNDKKYKSLEILDILKNLSKQNSSSFSASSLIDSIYSDPNVKDGNWDPKDYFKGENVILIGGGKSVKKYKRQILALKEKENAKIVFLNLNKYLNTHHGDLTIVSHPLRVLIESSKYSSLKHPIVMPVKNLEEIFIKEKIKFSTIFDYGLNLKKNAFLPKKYSMFSEWHIVNSYGLGIIHKSNPKKIYLAGFDGFEADSRKNDEIEKIFKKYTSLKNSKKLYSITPTIHPTNMLVNLWK